MLGLGDMAKNYHNILFSISRNIDMYDIHLPLMGKEMLSTCLLHLKSAWKYYLFINN